MPTGRMTFTGGLTSQAIQVPKLPGSSKEVRGSSSGTGGGVSARVPNPIIIPAYGADQTPFYAGFTPSVAKANYIAPTDQGHRAALDSRQSMMIEPRDNPSRSQFSQGYTDPIQQFASSNTWQLAGPVDSPGTRAKQPNTKFVSPFSSMPIPVRMPWDL